MIEPYEPKSCDSADELCCCQAIEIHVQGELDLSTVPRMRERLHEALSLQPERLVVDLSECTFFDAMGINMLLELHRRAWRQNAAFTLRGCSDRHYRLLALMGLRNVFDIESRRARSGFSVS
ncbi:MAG: STAS domain-containing protein [Frankiaceae bacterium]|nr:STAS domain-containing protein [Frankiaceae bacterium]